MAYPTESCYGLGCDPRQHRSVKRLLKIKRRHWQHGLILIASRVNQLRRYVDGGQHNALARASQSWPGPNTWLLPVRPGVSRWLTGEFSTIAARVTAHRDAAALCNHSRLALVSTSANRHGRPPTRSAKAVGREFGNEIDYILVGKIGLLANPTEIRDALTDRLVRAG